MRNQPNDLSSTRSIERLIATVERLQDEIERLKNALADANATNEICGDTIDELRAAARAVLAADPPPHWAVNRKVLAALAALLPPAAIVPDAPAGEGGAE